jgi:hypothetical protein
MEREKMVILSKEKTGCASGRVLFRGALLGFKLQSEGAMIQHFNIHL